MVRSFLKVNAKFEICKVVYNITENKSSTYHIFVRSAYLQYWNKDIDRLSLIYCNSVSFLSIQNKILMLDWISNFLLNSLHQY